MSARRGRDRGLGIALVGGGLGAVLSGESFESKVSFSALWLDSSLFSLAFSVYEKTLGRKRWVDTFATRREVREAERDALRSSVARGSETCGDFARRWLTDCPREAAASRKTYRYAIKGFQEDFARVRLRDLDKPIARQWALTQPQSNVRTVRTMFTDAINDGLHPDPNPSGPTPRTYDGCRRCLASPVGRDETRAESRLIRRAWRYPDRMAEQSEFEFVFEPQDEGGYHVYAPDLPGLHTQGEDIDDAVENAQEALALYVEGLREEGRPVGSGIVRRRLAVPA